MTKIIINRAERSITVEGDLYDFRPELTRWYKDDAHSIDYNTRNREEIRAAALAGLNDLYGRWIDEYNGYSEYNAALDQAEPVLAYVAEALATMHAADLDSCVRPSSGGIDYRTAYDLVQLARTGKLPNPAAAERTAAAKAALTPPELPACVPTGSSWNRKVYGSSYKGYYIFADGDRIDLTPEDADALKAYLDASEQFQQTVTRAGEDAANNVPLVIQR